MRVVVFILAFLVCAGQGHRVQKASNTTRNSGRREAAHRLRALASLLVAARDSSAAWHSSVQTLAGHHHSGRALAGGPTRPARAWLSPAMVTEVEEEDVAVKLRAEDTRHRPLYDWLESGGAELGPIYLDKSKFDGFGGFASRDIEEGEVIFVIPTKACVNTYDACGDADIGKLLANLTMKGQGGATVSLAISIAKEWLCENNTGPRGPFLDLLPWGRGGDQEQEHVVWWTWDQMKDLEGSSEALRDAWFVREEVQNAVMVGRAVLKDVIRDNYKKRGKNVIEVFNAEKDIANAMRGAFVTILSRSFADTISNDELETRLIPLLDMIQHDKEDNIIYENVVDEETGENFVQVSAFRPIKKGQEFFLDYNFDLSDSKFLSRFGFIPDTTIPAYVEKLKGNRSLMTKIMINWPRPSLPGIQNP